MAVYDYGSRLREDGAWLTVRGLAADDGSGGERHGDVGLAELGVCYETLRVAGTSYVV